ncbi:MAG: AAA family ATPase [Blastocatellia bacterium]
MRIDRLTLHNFRKFENLTLDLHPQFNLLVGGNGSGKTTILDALAISMTEWFEVLEKSGLGSFSKKELLPKDIHLKQKKVSDRLQFEERSPTTFVSRVRVGREVVDLGRTTIVYSHDELLWSMRPSVRVISQLVLGVSPDFPSTCPVFALYGVSRAVLAGNQIDPSGLPIALPRRWDAYRHWVSEQIDYDSLRRWFFRESAAAGVNNGRKRPGYEVVRQAVFGCLPEADDLWFDVDRADLVCSIDGQAQPLGNLSDGQRMLLAMVADIAIRAVTLNAHLLPADELGPEDKPLPRVLRETPGIVLIDELDLHLHPSWQRRVVADLKRTFPAIQFVATTHSPQIIGEVPPDEIRIIDGEHVYSPDHSFGMDSSRILEEIMGTSPRTVSIENMLAKLSRQISDDDFDAARVTIEEMKDKLGEDDPEITQARTLMEFVEQG